jgi:integrase
MDDDDWSPRSFNNYVAYLNSVWTWAEDEGLVRENPILKIEKFGKRYLTKEVIVPSLALIRTIFALSAKPQFKHLRAALDLGFGLAMRNSEISRLEWSNIQSDLIQVPNNVAKGGRGRNIQRTDLLNGVFESLNKAKRSNSNGPIILKGWRRSLTPLFEAAGLGKPRNIMRRSGASYFFHAAGSEAATRQMMGHTQNSGIFTSSYQALSFSSGQERIAISKADGLAYYQIWV